MKPFIKCRVYILTDSNGQWWEDIGQDGNTRLFKPGTSEFNDPKHFKNAKQAADFAKKLGYTYYQVLRLSPPVKPSSTWSEEVLEENLPDFTKGKTVVVKRLQDDMFSHDFEGIVVDVFPADCIVRDRDGLCWTVSKDQMSLLD